MSSTARGLRDSLLSRSRAARASRPRTSACPYSGAVPISRSMSDDHDVLVLGGGIAGVAAAVAAAQHGARVLLVRAGPGASALCLGGWRGVPPPRVGAALAHAGLALEQLRCVLPRAD